MRVIVGSITGIFMSIYLMYFAIPLLSTEHTNFNAVVNSTDPVIANSYALGAGFYNVIPLIPVFVAAFLIISYALKRDDST